MTLVLQMLKEICEHLELRDTIESRKFIELIKAHRRQRTGAASRTHDGR